MDSGNRAFKSIEDALRFEGPLYDDTIRDNTLSIEQVQVVTEKEQRVEITMEIIE